MAIFSGNITATSIAGAGGQMPIGTTGLPGINFSGNVSISSGIKIPITVYTFEYRVRKVFLHKPNTLLGKTKWLTSAYIKDVRSYSIHSTPPTNEVGA